MICIVYNLPYNFWSIQSFALSSFYLSSQIALTEYILLYMVIDQNIIPGADLGFKVMRGDFKKSRRAERGAKILGVFRVKNHDFTQKKSYVFQF